MSLVYKEYSEDLIAAAINLDVITIETLLSEARSRLEINDFIFELDNAVEALQQVDAMEAYTLLKQWHTKYKPLTAIYDRYEKLEEVRKIKERRKLMNGSTTLLEKEDGKIVFTTCDF